MPSIPDRQHWGSHYKPVNSFSRASGRRQPPSRSRALSTGESAYAKVATKGRHRAIVVAAFGQGEIGPDLFRAACTVGLEGLGVEAG